MKLKKLANKQTAHKKNRASNGNVFRKNKQAPIKIRKIENDIARNCNFLEGYMKVVNAIDINDKNIAAFCKVAIFNTQFKSYRILKFHSFRQTQTSF